MPKAIPWTQIRSVSAIPNVWRCIRQWNIIPTSFISILSGSLPFLSSIWWCSVLVFSRKNEAESLVTLQTPPGSVVSMGTLLVQCHKLWLTRIQLSQHLNVTVKVNKMSPAECHHVLGVIIDYDHWLSECHHRLAYDQCCVTKDW